MLFWTRVALSPLVTFGKGYIGIKAGVYLPQNGILEDADTGYGGEVRGGFYFNEYMASELELGYYQTRYPVQTVGTEIKNTFRIYPISLNLIFAKQFERVKPYLKAGVGYYLADVEGMYDTFHGSSFGFQFGTGISIDNMGIELKYISAEPEIEDIDFDISGPIITFFYGF